MDTKVTLERTCQQLESKYTVPDDFKVRIREILQPLFRHDLSADEMRVIERALERTYLRHLVTPADTPSGVAEAVLLDGGNRVQTLAVAKEHADTADPEIAPAGATAPDESGRPRAVTTGVPSGQKGKGGVLLVKIDPQTRTAQLIRLTAEDVKVIANKGLISDFLKETDDDTVVH